MATVKFSLLSARNPSAIYMRLIHGASLDVKINTKLYVNPKHWDKKNGKVRNIAGAHQKDFINATLERLKSHLFTCMNHDYANACAINRHWARARVLEFFGQRDDKKKGTSVKEWIEEYIEKVPTLIKKNKERPLSERTIISYKTTLGKIRAFQEYKNTQLKFTDINLAFHKEFIEYLSKIERLSSSSTGVIIKNLKALGRVAKIEGHRLHEEFEHPGFFVPRASSTKTESVYLSDEEINKIFTLDLSENERLDNARDCAIVGLRTGLRVSDFLKLDAKNIKADYIEVQTKKTGHKVIIPLHPQLKAVLEKKGGLPERISDIAFNLHFKEICKLAGITKETQGSLMNPKTRRKEEGIFAKYKLVSSHTCRRSFATNLYGKLPNLSIMAITGHKTGEAVFRVYQDHPEGARREA